ncbi:MAG: 4'-phosphopantetheinyl transferase superfamily protein [Steroidobacteraceae bacterium]
MHANRFTVAHARLRQILAALLHAAAADIEFSHGEHGKPALAGAAAHAHLQFNLSHSGSLGLVGWAWRRAIGVDVEVWRPMSDEAAVVRRFFSPAEIAAYDALKPQQRTRGFFHCWTRKEAYVKAVGRGLGLALASFDVSLQDGDEHLLLRASAVQDDGRSWSMAAPPMHEGISAAVVLEGGPFVIQPQQQNEEDVMPKLWG